jgi:hypothetical protein
LGKLQVQVVKKQFWTLYHSNVELWIIEDEKMKMWKSNMFKSDVRAEDLWLQDVTFSKERPHTPVTFQGRWVFRKAGFPT